jgi:L-lactate dehydrogenase complex protein LldG
LIVGVFLRTIPGGMFESFKARAEAVSGEVHRFATAAAAADFLADLLRAEGVSDRPGSRAVWAATKGLPGIRPEELAARIPGLTLDVDRKSAAESKVGISLMEWGLADTGTVVQDATDVRLRLVSTLPETHVALLRTGTILPDLDALLPHLDPARSPYLAFVTGPSRTADIERVLTIGVHGPVRLVVLCIDEPPADPAPGGTP